MSSDAFNLSSIFAFNTPFSVLMWDKVLYAYKTLIMSKPMENHLKNIICKKIESFKQIWSIPVLVILITKYFAWFVAQECGYKPLTEN